MIKTKFLYPFCIVLLIVILAACSRNKSNESFTAQQTTLVENETALPDQTAIPAAVPAPTPETVETARTIVCYKTVGDSATIIRNDRETPAREGYRLSEGYAAVTGEASNIYFVLNSNSLLKMDETTKIEIDRLSGKTLHIALVEGAVSADIQREHDDDVYEVRFGHTVLGIRGTSFIAEFRDDEPIFVMLTGSGYINGEMHLTAGHIAIIAEYDTRIEPLAVGSHLSAFVLSEIVERGNELIRQDILTVNDIVTAMELLADKADTTPEPTPEPAPEPTPQTAAAGSVIDFTYEINSSRTEVDIRKYVGNDSVVVIPAEIEGIPVRNIGSHAFASNQNLTAITIPYGITGIGLEAFMYCANLTRITIPDSVMIIGESAFFECARLTEVTLGSGVTHIWHGAFTFCVNLTSITIPASVVHIGEAAFGVCDNLTAVYFEGNAPTMGYDVFYGANPNLIIYYREGAIGFTNPWQGVETRIIGSIAAVTGGNAIDDAGPHQTDAINPAVGAAVGDTVRMGNLDWIVLTFWDGGALLLSEKILYIMPYHSPGDYTTWEDSTLREFLNGPFYYNTFSEQERRIIMEKDLLHIEFGGGPSGWTQDRVFIPSLEDVGGYLGDPLVERNRGFRIGRYIETGEIMEWWLRTLDSAGDDAIIVCTDGSYDVYDRYIGDYCGVRPAIWLRLD
jgi:hypothetical protein